MKKNKNMINLFIIIASTISILLILLGYLVLKKKKNITNVSFFLFSTSGAVWIMISFLENLVSSILLANVLLRLDFLIGAFVVFLSFVFLFNFPKENKKFNKLIPLFFLPTFIVSFFSFSDLLIYNVGIGKSGVFFSEGVIFPIYSFILIANVFSGIINQFIQYKKESGVGRMQIKYVLIGFLTFSLLAVFNLSMQNQVPLFIFRLMNFSPVILFVCIFYAIIKYRLLDVRYVLRLSAVFSFLLVVVIGVYASLSYLMSHLLGMREPWLYIIPSIMIVIAFERIKEAIADLSDKILFQKKYRFSEIASDINHEIRSSGLDLKKSLTAIESIVSDMLKVSGSAVFIISDQGEFLKYHFGGEGVLINKIDKKSLFVQYFEHYPKEILDKDELLADFGTIDEKMISREKIILEMEKSGISLLSPIMFEDRLLGFYAFTNKLSNDYFKQEDFTLIKHVIWQISLLINNNSIYESLKKVDKEKSRLISVISHQFRTPLSSIRFNLELCRDNSLNKKDKDNSLKEAYQGVLTIDSYLDQLLLVLEMENTGFSLKKSKVFFDEITEPVFLLEEKNIRDKKLKIKKDIFDENFIFEVDKEKIIKALHIIFSNAVKYSFEEGEIELNIEKKYLSGKENLVFSVKDKGMGIEDESLNNIAKKFFRGKQAFSLSPEGFGLNLFIARKIIEAHNGVLWFERGKNSGSIFYLSLPL